MGLLNFVFDHPVITVLVIIFAINIFGSDDATEEKAAVEVDVVTEETSSIKEVAKNIIDDVKVMKEALTERAMKALEQVKEEAPEEEVKEPVIVEREKPKKDRLNTATVDNPYGKIGNRY